jgi:hypothetical protein
MVSIDPDGSSRAGVCRSANSAGLPCQPGRIWAFPVDAGIGLDRPMATVHSIIRTFDYVWDRLRSRLAGLADDEYFWEPVAGCWSLRQGDDGRWRLDGGGAGVRRLSRFPWQPSPGGSGTLEDWHSAASPIDASATATSR